MTNVEKKRAHIVDDLVADTLVIYSHLLTPATIGELQASLRNLILTHPDGRGLMGQLLAHPERLVSAAITRQDRLRNFDR